MLQRQHREERSRQYLDGAYHNPARASRYHRHPPAQTPALFRRRQKPQKIHLLADLRYQRENHTGCRTKKQQTQSFAIAVRTFILHPVIHRVDVMPGDIHKWQQLQRNPQRLTPQLEAADKRNAVGHQWNHQQRTDQITDGEWNTKQNLECHRHDGRLDGKKDKGERRIDQRRNRRADIAKSCTTGEQVDIDAVLGRIVRNRQSHHENDGAHHTDGCHGIIKAVIQGNGRTNGFQRQKRNRSQRRIGDPCR